MKRGSFVGAFLKVLNHESAARAFKVPDEYRSWANILGINLALDIRRNSLVDVEPFLLKFARPAFRVSLGQLCYVAFLKTRFGAHHRMENNIPEPLFEEALLDITPVHRSKFGGCPDLPEGMSWPRIRDCISSPDQNFAKSDDYASFLGQINFDDASATSTSRFLHHSGILSVFGYGDRVAGAPSRNNSNFSTIFNNVKVFYFHKNQNLKRMSTPHELMQPGLVFPSCEIQGFEPILDLPNLFHPSGPWASEIYDVFFNSNDITLMRNARRFQDSIDYRNGLTLFGYANMGGSPDPTPSRDDRHVITISLEGMSLDVQSISLQMSSTDLQLKNYHKIRSV